MNIMVGRIAACISSGWRDNSDKAFIMAALSGGIG